MLPRHIEETPEGHNIRGGIVVFQQTGPISPDQEVGNFQFPPILFDGASNFSLRAFDWQLNLDEVVLRLAPLICALNESVAKAATDAIATEAQKLNRPKADLSQHFGANYSLMLEFTVDSNGSVPQT